MTIIRKLKPSDKTQVRNMISFMGSVEAEKFAKRLIQTSCDLFHYWLPLKLKFMAESYVLVDDNNELQGMITVAPTSGNPQKINIIKLLFKNEYYDVGKHLVEFIISRFGAKGAQTFHAAVDDSHDELLKLFTDGCGFRKCASEELWRIETSDLRTPQTNAFRNFKASDAQAVAMLFNDSIITHFKPSLLKTKNEYSNHIFNALTENSELKYVLEDVNLKTLAAYFSLKTYDNHNYVLDITVSNGVIPDYDAILGFIANELKKRQNKFSLFVKLKKYALNSKDFEEYLINKNFKCVQNQMILVKDFYKLIKQEAPNSKVILFAETTGKPVFKSEL